MNDSTLKVAQKLKSTGLGSLSVLILDALRPLAVFGAQLMFVLEPLFGSTRESLNDLGRILEDPEQTEYLLNYLRQED